MRFDQILDKVGPKFRENAPIIDRENQFAKENLLELKELGAYKSIIPEDLGGGGQSYSELCYFLKDLAKFCPSTALTLSMHQHLVAVLVFKHLNGDQGATNTLRMVTEKNLVLVSTGGGDFVSSNGEATKVDGGYKISARKSFCSGSPIGNVAVTSCALKEQDREYVIHFSVPLNAEGVEILDDWNAMGMRGTGSNTILFKDVLIPDEKVALKRDRGKWHPVWDVVGTLAFPIFMAPYAGVVESIVENTTEIFSGRRDQASASKACLGRMHNNYQITQWAIDEIIHQVKNFDIKPTTESAAKAIQNKSIISKHGRESAQAAMEALGGYSYFKKPNIERLYRDLLAGEFHPMQSGKQEEAMGNYLMGGGLVD